MQTILVFSKDRPMQLHAYLESFYAFFAKPEGDIFVLYKPSQGIDYAKVIRSFPNVKFIVEQDFFVDTLSIIEKAHPYIMFGCDDVLFTGNFSLNAAEELLSSQKDIFGFSLRLGKNISPYPPVTPLSNNMQFWDWQKASYTYYNHPWELDCTLYRKQDILEAFSTLSARPKNPNMLEGCISENPLLFVKRPLLASYNKGKALVITVNRMQNSYPNAYDDSSATDIFTLNTLYNVHNNILDIHAISKIANREVHVGAEYFILKHPVESNSKKHKKSGLRTFINNIRYLFRYNLKDVAKNSEAFEDKVKRKKFAREAYRQMQQSMQPNIVSYEDSIDIIKDQGLSLARFGDGEFTLMLNQDIPFQKTDGLLAKRLKEVLGSQHEKVALGIPKFYFDFTIDILSFVADFTDEFTAKHESFFEVNINTETVYHPTELTQLYQSLVAYPFDLYFERMRSLWLGRDVAIICGETVFNNLEYSIFDTAKSIEYIHCASKNAFSDYNEIYSKSLQINKTKLILLILGPTATVLAYDLTLAGYQALDMGHIAKDYDSYKKQLPRTKKEIFQFFMPD